LTPTRSMSLKPESSAERSRCDGKSQC
jgi:hypothetical protein